MAGYTVFIDFDNTVTTTDILDDILSRFSRDDVWVSLEERWRRGEIGSRECLEGQMAGLEMDEEELDRYLSGVRIDPDFKRLLSLFRSHGVGHMILSDNFDYILKKILDKNGISDIKVYSNSLKLSDNRVSTSFDLSDRECGKCAHCKKGTMRKNLKKGTSPVYIGDGLSDVHAAKESDIVFAKDYLETYFKDNNLPYIPFKGMVDVYKHFKDRLL